MPHNFYSLPITSPNPGRWSRERVERLCEEHEGRLEGFWTDDPENPSTAFVLVRDGKTQALRGALHATLHLGPIHEET